MYSSFSGILPIQFQPGAWETMSGVRLEFILKTFHLRGRFLLGGLTGLSAITNNTTTLPRSSGVLLKFNIRRILVMRIGEEKRVRAVSMTA